MLVTILLERLKSNDCKQSVQQALAYVHTAGAVFGFFLNSTNIVVCIILFVGGDHFRDFFDNQEFTALLNVLMKCPLIEIVSSKHTGVSS